ncbi:hypothetical protein BS17DRAFT_792931 [Gyrodon lividus]|nr:hypothetical protein BS17DRAFT_792931 [Gyrodon lividus]
MDSDSVPFPVPPALHRRHDDPLISEQHHPSSGFIYGRGETLLDKLKEDKNKRHQEHAMYYLFQDDSEWDLGKFLTKHLTLSAINEFLQLKWRDHSEFFTGDRVHHIQDQLIEGATIIPIIIGSDKTPVTKHTGRLEMHTIFVTIGSIQSDVWMQVTSHAWRCIAFMPIPSFDVHPDFQTLLILHVFHRCMDIAFGSLKQRAQTGCSMTDGLGCIRNCFTLLVSYIADLPEQQLVACVSNNASPVTTAMLPEFGDRQSTLQLIQQVCSKVDPWDIKKFQKQAKLVKLLSVHQPFWRDWKFADPTFSLNGEVPHTCHKFFFDYILKWCKEVAGNYLLDT